MTPLQDNDSSGALEDKLITVLQDALERPKTYFLTAVELEAMLFAMVHLYAHTPERQERLTKAFQSVQNDGWIRYGSLCRSELKKHCPTFQESQSDSLFNVVTVAYEKIIRLTVSVK